MVSRDVIAKHGSQIVRRQQKNQQVSCLPGGISAFLGVHFTILHMMHHTVVATQRVWPIHPVHLASRVYASGVDMWIGREYVPTQGHGLSTAGSVMKKMEPRQLAVPKKAVQPPPTQYHISGIRKRSPTIGVRAGIRHTASKGTLSTSALPFREPDQHLWCSSCSQVFSHNQTQQTPACNLLSGMLCSASTLVPRSCSP